jgi:itaconyl-CoA hydratase
VVKVETRGFNQDGKLVIRYQRSVMVYKREHAPARDLFPVPEPPPPEPAKARE